ncbi:GIY-YIG nuclease family protein [Candidatus Saccharibacteria bacterium]|nr:GIY-YIG nuclease family protein [Candidatus Saccharibacteria bacterium]
MFYFYVLKSSLDSKYYFGSSTDLRRRLIEHNSGKVKSTATRLPLNLVYYEAYTTEELARKRESTVKRSGTARDSIYKRIGA